MKGFVFMAVAAHRKQMWLFRRQCSSIVPRSVGSVLTLLLPLAAGLIVANVRLVFSVILLAFDFPYLANNLNHPLAQSSFVSYRYTLFFVGLRYSLIWPLYWCVPYWCVNAAGAQVDDLSSRFYLHGVLTHLHVSWAAEGKQLYSPRLFAAAMNLGMFLMPTSVAIGPWLLLLGTALGRSSTIRSANCDDLGRQRTLVGERGARQLCVCEFGRGVSILDRGSVGGAVHGLVRARPRELRCIRES